MAFLNWRFGLTQTPIWRIEVAPFPHSSNVAAPTKPIITIPTSIYGYGNGDDAEEGGAGPCVDEWAVSIFTPLWWKQTVAECLKRGLSDANGAQCDARARASGAALRADHLMCSGE